MKICAVYLIMYAFGQSTFTRPTKCLHIIAQQHISKYIADVLWCFDLKVSFRLKG